MTGTCCSGISSSNTVERDMALQRLTFTNPMRAESLGASRPAGGPLGTAAVAPIGGGGTGFDSGGDDTPPGRERELVAALLAQRQMAA